MATVAHQGHTLAYDHQGSGSPALVFIHGWTCNRSFFAPQFEHFARRHQVVAVDLLGHGESDKPEGEYSIAGYADDVAYLIDRLDLGRVLAVGHSMGAITALQLAAEHPGRVAAIIMIDPAPFVWGPELRTGMEGILAAIEAGDQEPRRQFISNHLFLPGSPAHLKERVLAVMMSAPSHVATAAMRGILEFDAPAVAARCNVPALHLAATPPLNPPHLMSQWLPNVVNGWTVGAGHFNQMEAPDQVNSMIEGFLRHYVGDAPGSGPG